MIKKDAIRLLAASLALPAFLAGCNGVYMAGVTPPTDRAPAPVFSGTPSPEFSKPVPVDEFLALEDLPPVPSYPDMGIQEGEMPVYDPEIEAKGTAWEQEMPDYRQVGMSDVLDLSELPPVPEMPDYSDPETRTEVPEWIPPAPEAEFDDPLLGIDPIEMVDMEPAKPIGAPPAMPRVPFAEPPEENFAPTIEERPFLEIENPTRVVVPLPAAGTFPESAQKAYQIPAQQANGMPHFITVPYQEVPPAPSPAIIALQQRARIQAPHIRAPRMGDEGRTVAEAHVMSPQEFAQVNKGSAPDCSGRGLGVRVSNSLGDSRYDMDKDGQPCGETKTLFNGEQKSARRLNVVSGIDIAFVNETGAPQAPAIHEPDPLLVYFPGATAPQSPEEMAQTEHMPDLEGATTLNEGMSDVEWVEASVAPQHKKYQPGTLEATVHEWQDKKVVADRRGALNESQQLMADLKEIREMADGDMAMHYQQQVDELMRRLRESEIKAALSQERHVRTTERLEMSQEEREAVEQAWREEQRRLSKEAGDLNNQLVEMQDAHLRLKKTYSTRERSYMEKIAKLTEDLKRAEHQAGKARKEMVLEAAKKIAEAERLAFAARLAERDEIVRRAERLKLEGDVMMQRADDMQNNRTVVVPGLAGEFGEEFPPAPPEVAQNAGDIEPAAALPPMSKVPVVLHVEQMQLKEVFAQVFGQMEPMMGKWDVKWELAGANQGILYELWTVTAETRFDEFLDFIAGKVEETHGVTLNFSRFDKNKMFIISD